MHRSARRLRRPASVLAAVAWLLAKAAAGGTDTPEHGPPRALVVPFAVEGEPVRWALASVPAPLPPLERLRRLWRALLAVDGGGLGEDSAHTATAAEAFAERRANCVGFANLFVGLARELGVDVYFVLVDGVAPAGSNPHTEDALAVREGHLAAAWGPADDRRVFDFAGETAGRELAVRPITDLSAIALFYSNRGVEALLAGRAAEAVEWLRTAAELEPSALPSTWINLGVALRRVGALEEADAAYQRALELDPAAHAAYRNLAALLALRGQRQEAAELLATAAALSRLDAHAALRLARQRLLAGELQAARGLYRRALDAAQQPPQR